MGCMDGFINGYRPDAPYDALSHDDESLPDAPKKMHARDHWGRLEAKLRSEGREEEWEKSVKPPFVEKPPRPISRRRRVWVDRRDGSGRTALGFAAGNGHVSRPAKEINARTKRDEGGRE